MSYENYYNRAERGMVSSDVVLMVFSGKYDEKLNAEISVMVRKRAPVYLLLKAGEQPPVALGAAGLIQDTEIFSSFGDDFLLAGKRLLGRLAERKRREEA